MRVGQAPEKLGEVQAEGLVSPEGWDDANSLPKASMGGFKAPVHGDTMGETMGPRKASLGPKPPQAITSLSAGQLQRLTLSQAQIGTMSKDELIMASLGKSSSAPHLGATSHGGIPKNYRNLPQQIDSKLSGSAKFNFGKREHGLGKFLIPRKSPRSSYLGVNDTPGVGEYDMDIHNCGSDRFFIRKPRYSFGLSQTEQDPMVKRFTPWSQVRGMGYHDNPGPGTYFGPEGGDIERFGGEKNSLQNQQPRWSMTAKREASKGYHWDPTPGADVYYVEGYKDQFQNKRQFPRYGIGTQKRAADSLVNKVSTTALGGPGRYKHSISLVTQFPGKQTDKSVSLAEQDRQFRKSQLV